MPESLLRYWREDPLLSEHHEHWHLVYPYEGRVDDNAHTKEELKRFRSEGRPARYKLWNSRHGELFAYMHAQFLARYAAERLSLGLDPVRPFDDYQKPIEEGYQPHPDLVLKFRNTVIHPAPRPNNIRLKDIVNPRFAARPGAKVEAQELFRDRFLKAIEAASSPNRPISISDLSERIEPTARLETSYFGSLHNDGHVLISMYDDNPDRPGCLFWEAITVRDPVFYQWHAHIDNLFRKYQNTLDPYDFYDLPQVKATQLTVTGISGTPNNLLTEMRTRTVTPRNNEATSKADVTKPIELEYLSHGDFSYRITAVNKARATLPVTVRISMTPEQFQDDRTLWMEMDKFQIVLPVGESTFERTSRSSSVVRHPVWTADMLESPETGPDESGVPPGCRCGWPYTLLLPRGKPEGMNFRFALLVTPGEDILPRVGGGQDSSSYCGLVDSDYPDRRAMGYPFNRPFGMPVKDWLTGGARPQQLISTIVTIRHLDRISSAR